MSALSLIVAMFVLLAVFMFAAYKQKDQKNGSEKPGTEVYWLEGNEIMLNGEKTGITPFLTPGIVVDPEKHAYYVCGSGEPDKLKVVKDWKDLYLTDLANFDNAMILGAGGGFLFLGIYIGKRKDLLLRRISDQGQVDTFTLHKGKGDFDFFVNCICGDSKGNAYVAGEVKNENGKSQAVIWSVTVDGIVSRQVFADGTIDTNCEDVTTSGTDVLALVFEGYFVKEPAVEYNLALYKNGQRQYLVTDDVNKASSTCCCISVVGNDTYISICYGDPNKQKIIVYKNKEQILILEEPDKGLLLNAMYVTKSGDIYISGHDYAVKSVNYVWKNGKVIANPKNYCFTLYVKE